MKNIAGTNLSVDLPFNVLKSLGKIEGSESIQKFYEDIIINEFSDIELNTEDKNIIPYISNSMFLSLIITKMIEQDINFSEAFINSQSSFNNVITEFNNLVELIKTDEEYKKIFANVKNVVHKHIKEFLEKMQNQPPKGGTFSTELQNISRRISNLFMHSKLPDIIASVVNSDGVKSVIYDKFIKSNIESFNNYISTINEKFELDLDEEEINIMKEKFYDFYETIPLQTILSFVLTKAINEDITFSETLLTYDEDELIKQSIDKIMSYDKLPEITIPFTEISGINLM